MKNHIILQSVRKRRAVDLTGVVRINPEAEETLMKLKAETGLSMSMIASQMIVQGAELVKIISSEEIE